MASLLKAKKGSFQIRFTWVYFLGILFLLGACVPSGLQLPESPLLSSLERKSGLIAYTGLDGNIYSVDQGGGHQAAVTSDAALEPDAEGRVRFYQYPAWARDNRRLAFVGIEGSATEISTVRLFNAASNGEDMLEIFNSSDQLPFYLYWSPDSKLISFLASSLSGSDISLLLVPSQGGDSQTVHMGSPLYWAWAPDNRSIVIHSGGATNSGRNARLAIHTFAYGGEDTQLDMRPVAFQAPTWSPDGKEMLLAVEAESEGVENLILADDHGSLKRPIADINSPVAFGWSPNGDRIAFISNIEDGLPGSGNKLMIVDPREPEKAKQVSEDAVVAFFWSPDSKKVAYFTPTLVTADETDPSQQSLGFQAQIYNLINEKTQDVGAFVPTQQFSSILSFFDQYQHSISLWSPDSRNLVLSAQLPDGSPSIFVVEASGNLKPRYVADGYLGVWSWK